METVDSGIPCRAVIVTALPIEFSAVCDHLEERKEDTHPQGTVYERGQFRPTSGREWEVIVVEIGPGNPGAAAEVERGISYCKPNVILFAGVAGGLKDVAIGDVVVGNKVYGYESGKESAGFRPRPSVHESNYRLTQRAKAEARNGNWRRRIIGGFPDSPPRALVGPIAAGEKVVADSQSATSQLIANTYGDALAVEMEGYGFLHGVYLNQHISALVVRGISDLLDGKESSDRTGSQERASRHASAFCFEVLAKLDTCPGETEAAPNGDPPYAVEFVRMQRTLAEHETRFQSIEIALGLRAVADTANPAATDNRFTSEMNAARDLLSKGHARAARLILDSLAKKVCDEGFTEELRFRLETNLGGSALALQEYQTAEEHFEAALTIRPSDSKALANRAQIALVLGQVVVGLDYAIRAMSLSPRDPHVMSVYLRSLDANGRIQEVQGLVRQNPWLYDNPECAFTLAHLAYDDGRYEEAEKLARTSAEQTPDDAQAFELLARSIVVPLESGLERNPPLPGKLPTEAVTRASEAESLYSRAIEVLEHQDYRELLLVAVANRGMVAACWAETRTLCTTMIVSLRRIRTRIL
jgi:nucleoside phosphorylase/Flp pilus assembly protein TadD